MSKGSTLVSCCDCGYVCNMEEEGAHIYPDGSVLCADCEGDNE